ncbi:MAG: glycoside hydrolase family 20 zincin-like fold domain-containing protein [Promethearchaeota archaeon]
MFIYLENLVNINNIREELNFLPQPRHFKQLGDLNYKVVKESLIYSDISENHSFILDQLQEKLLSFGLERKLEQRSLNSIKNINYLEDPLTICSREFPNLNLERELNIKNMKEQGYLIISMNSSLLIKAESLQGLFYATQTLIQALNVHQNKLIVDQFIIIDYPLLQIRGISDDISTGTNYIKFKKICSNFESFQNKSILSCLYARYVPI